MERGNSEIRPFTSSVQLSVHKRMLFNEQLLGICVCVSGESP